MKKKILITAMTCMLAAGTVFGIRGSEAQAASKVAINKKNFPDKVFRELVRVNYDKNKDKKLSKSEIKKATSFGTGSRKTSVKIKPSKYAKYTKKYVSDIKSFKGVSKLTNLKKFVACETTVKTVSFKKNKKLTKVVMTDGKLKKMDLNSNKKLKYVDLSYNQLTSLKINKCKKLEFVDLTGHMIKKLKINRNKKTEVLGEEYYKPYESKKISVTLKELNDGGCLDANGKYCIYEWSSDYSSCVKRTINGTSVTAATVVMDAAAQAKAKIMQNITAQWQDAQGNFYFIADRDGDMIAKTVNYLYKISPQGHMVQEIVLNNQMSISANYKNRFHLYFMNQKNGIVTLKLLTNKTTIGVVYFDMAKMQVVRQAECNFEPVAAEGDVVAGKLEIEDRDYAVVSKMPAGSMVKTESGTQVEVSKLSASHRMNIPLRSEEYLYPFALTINNNYVYLISGEGFFKAKFTDKKFKQIYGVSKISGLQDTWLTCSMAMVSEKEMYLLTKKVKDEDESVTYKLISNTVK